MDRNPMRELIRDVSPFLALLFAVLSLFSNIEISDLKEDISSLEDEISEISWQNEETSPVEYEEFSLSDYDKAFGDGYAAALDDIDLGNMEIDMMDKLSESYASGYIDGYDDCRHGVPNGYE